MRTVALAASAILVGAALTGCSSAGGPDPAVASLEARLAVVEDRLAGVEAVVGQALIAEPATQLQIELDALEKDIASAQLPEDVVSELEAARQAALDAQSKAQDAIAAQEAQEAAAKQAVEDAQQAIDDARAKVDAVKEKIHEFLASASPTVNPQSSASG